MTYYFTDVSGITTPGAILPAREVADGSAASPVVMAEDAAFVCEAVAQRVVVPGSYGAVAVATVAAASPTVRHDAASPLGYAIEKLFDLFHVGGVYGNPTSASDSPNAGFFTYLDPSKQIAFDTYYALDGSAPLPFASLADRKGDGGWCSSVTSFSPVVKIFEDMEKSGKLLALYPHASASRYALNFWAEYGLANIPNYLTGEAATRPPLLPHNDNDGDAVNLAAAHVISLDELRAAFWLVSKMTRTLHWAAITSDKIADSSGTESPVPSGMTYNYGYFYFSAGTLDSSARITLIGNVHVTRFGNSWEMQTFPPTLAGANIATAVHLYALFGTHYTDSTNSSVTADTYAFGVADLGDMTASRDTIAFADIINATGLIKAGTGGTVYLQFFATVDWDFPATVPSAWTWKPPTA